MRHVVLLRGINVGGHRKLPMAELRELAVGLGYADPVTYIQSGNLILSSSDTPQAIGGSIALAVGSRYGYEVGVTVRSRDDLVAAVDAYPFDRSIEKHRHIGFLSAAPSGAHVDGLARTSEPPEEFLVIGRELHLHLGLGVGKSRLMRYDFAKNLGVEMTVRNWRTVGQLIELMG